nr:hybrid signal transduction histidine kinase M [Tanacetum cinerariifolium]
LGLKTHVEAEASSTNSEWCKLDDLIKMWILRSLCDSLQEQVVTTPDRLTINEYCTKIKSMADRLKNLGCVVSEKNLVIYAVNGLDSRFATLVEIIRHREPLPTFETVQNMLFLKESSIQDQDQSRSSTTFESSSSSPTVLMATNSSDT